LRFFQTDNVLAMPAALQLLRKKIASEGNYFFILQDFFPAQCASKPENPCPET